VDVFKYLKKADAFLAENDESQARKDAERAGGVTSKFGRYYNAKDEYVGKIVGDKFVPASKDKLSDRMAAVYDKNAPDIPVQNRLSSD